MPLQRHECSVQYALIGACQDEGYVWADEPRQVIGGNVDYACDYIARHFNGVEVFKPKGTYMLFADCTKWCEEHVRTLDELKKAAWDVGVAVRDERAFYGSCHLRINPALPLSRVQEAFARLDKYIFNA